MSDLRQEIENRRTFAIISHPDAGKTTITEKFLLYGGAIQEAGMVKGKKNSRHAVSDWMEIEKQRGISVTSSVLQFRYDNYCINILDTPGHQDFFLGSMEEAQGTLLVGLAKIKTMPVEMYGIILDYPGQAGAVFGILLMIPALIMIIAMRKYIGPDAIAGGFKMG